MAYFEEDGINDDGGRTRDVERPRDGAEYVKLICDSLQSDSTPTNRKGSSLWCWVKTVFCFICLGLLAFVAFKWVGPLVIEKVSSYSSFHMLNNAFHFYFYKTTCIFHQK